MRSWHLLAFFLSTQYGCIGPTCRIETLSCYPTDPFGTGLIVKAGSGRDHCLIRREKGFRRVELGIPNNSGLAVYKNKLKPQELL